MDSQRKPGSSLDLVKRLCLQVKQNATLRLTVEERVLLDKHLSRVLVHFDDMVEHIRLLAGSFDQQFEFPIPRRDRLEPFEPRPSIKFPVHGRLSDSEVVTICESGLSALSDNALASLAINPDAIFDLFDVIDDVQPEHWMEVTEQTANAILGTQPMQFSQEIERLGPVSNPPVKAAATIEMPRPMSWLAVSQTIASFASLAALILLCFLLTPLLRRSKGGSVAKGGVESPITVQSGIRSGEASYKDLLGYCDETSPKTSLESLSKASPSIGRTILKLADAGLTEIQAVNAIRRILLSKQKLHEEMLELSENLTPAQSRVFDHLQSNDVDPELLLEVLHGFER